MAKTNGNPPTNGAAESPKADSLLTPIREAWGKMPEPARTKALQDAKKPLEAYRAATEARIKAQEALDAATEQQAAACLALAKAVGAQSFRFDGEVVDFAVRGDLVFLRRKGADVVSIGG